MRTGCPWKVNIQLPPDRDRPYISSSNDVHNHPTPYIPARLLDNITLEQVREVEKICSKANLSRREIIEVRTQMY